MKHFIWIAAAVCMLQACVEHTGYTIKGNLTEADGRKIVLKKFVMDSAPVPMDSCIVKDGKFEMKGEVAYPEYCELYVGNNGPLLLFVENAVIDIAVDAKNVRESKVTGSKETDLLVAFDHNMSSFEQNIKKVNDDYMDLKLSGVADVEKETGYLEQMNQIRQQRIDYMKQFVEEHPNTILAALVVDKSLSYYVPADQLETYAGGFDATNSQSPWVQSMKEKIAATKRLADGQPFPDISLPAPDGQMVALSDYAGKGKYVLIDFWASWCGPCRMANPQIVELYDRYKDKGFEIVGISLDKDKNEWLKAIEDDRLTWPHMSDLKFWQSAGARLYSVNSIPYAVLLDKDGKILAKGLRPNELDKKLTELLDN